MNPALLIVPPLLKYLAGPLLGPAQLTGVARGEGVPIRVLDLNAAWLRAFPAGGVGASPAGDHARPEGGFSLAAESWWLSCDRVLGPPEPDVPEGEHASAILAYTADAVDTAAERLTAGQIGREWARLLAGSRPRFVGVSVLWSGQVLGGLVATQLVRERWPGVPVIWGGAHVAALAPEIAVDARYGRWIDGFVAGYAERTFREMLQGDPLAAPGVFFAGSGAPVRALDEPDIVPSFSGLWQYGQPRLTLPVQTTRGCAYSRCAFCTYPAIEGDPRDLELSALDEVVRRAERGGAQVAVKDALATSSRLDAIARVVGGRVRWAACTRLVPRLGRERLRRLVEAGLATLEIGVESVDERQLHGMRKDQPVALVDGLLADAAGLDICIVLNTMWGFPGQSVGEALAEEREIRSLVDRHPRTRVFVERNRLQVERRSLLAASPDAFGIELERSWPWSSVLGWSESTVSNREVA